MAARSPDELDVVVVQQVTGLLDVVPVVQLVGNVMQPATRAAQKVDGVVVGAAAQEDEEIADPVGDAKSEDVAIPLRLPLHVIDEKGPYDRVCAG